MMIMAMDYIGVMFPFAYPVANSNLESDETFRIVIIAVYLFPVEQAIDIDEVKIETKFVCFFFPL